MDNYQDEVLKTLADDSQFFGDYVDQDELNRTIFGFLVSSAKLEQTKKSLFYGKNLAKFPTINPVRTDNPARFHAQMGIAGEAGELLNAATRENVRNEAGDLLWFLAVLLHTHDLTLDEVMRANIDKLRAKYASGKYTREEALNPRVR